MKRSYSLRLISLSLIAISLVNPVFIAFASDTDNSVSVQRTVTASAVVVPIQTWDLGFLIAGPASEIPVKIWDEVQAGQTLMVLDTPELEFAVIAAEQTLRAAQAEVEIQSYRQIEARRHGRVYLDIVPVEVRQLAAARAQQAQVALEIAQANLAEGTLIAPHEGTVVAISVIPGEFVQQNQVVITLATLDTFQVETTDLSERDIPKVKIGDPANIHIEAMNADLNGIVTGISPIASRVEGDVIYKVTIALDEQPKGLLWGMTAKVNITGK